MQQRGHLSLFCLATVLASCITLAACDKKDAAAQEGLPAVRAAIVAGNYGDAAELARKQAAAHPHDPAAQFELARAEALAGNRGHALDALDAAVKAGLADAGHVLEDHAFDAIRDDQRFAALIEKATPAPSGKAPDASALAAGSGPTRVQIKDGPGGTHIQAGDVKLDTSF